MSTSEHRAVDAESDLPISATELAAMASQLYAASIRPGFDSPPQSAPVAPRGNVLDTTAATSAGQHGGLCDPVPGAGSVARRLRHLRFRLRRCPEPEPPPQTVPVAPRGSAPDTTAAPSAAATTGGSRIPLSAADRPERVRGTHRGHRADDARSAGRSGRGRSGGAARFGTQLAAGGAVGSGSRGPTGPCSCQPGRAGRRRGQLLLPRRPPSRSRSCRTTRRYSMSTRCGRISRSSKRSSTESR